MTFFIEDPIQTYWDPDVISESLLIKSLEIYDQILGFTTIFWYNRLAAFRFILLYRSTVHTRREWFHLIIIIFTGSFNHWNGIAYYFSRDSFNERRIKKILVRGCISCGWFEKNLQTRSDLSKALGYLIKIE